MHYRIVEDARDGLWRWYLLEGRKAVARSMEAFTDADRCRRALERVLAQAANVQEWAGDPREAAPASPPTAEQDGEPGRFEDVGLKKSDEPRPQDGQAEPSPLPQIGR